MPTYYHYTTSAGLIGIIESRSFWATDCRYLNDTSEFRHGFGQLSKCIIEYKDDIQNIFPDSWTSMIGLRDFHENNSIAFISSFSRKPDVLSQWRGYNDGKGFCLGIDADWLNLNAQQQGFSLIPVVYDPEIQRRTVEAAVKLLIRMLEDTVAVGTATHDTIVQWWEHAAKVALAIKDKHFSEEDETRLIKVFKSWPSKVKVRPGPNGLIPYVSCFYDKQIISNPRYHPSNLGLEKIICGPALRSNQKSAVDAILAANHMRFPVENSEIPYVAE